MSFPPRPPPLGMPVPPFGFPPLGLHMPVPPMPMPSVGLVPRLLSRPALPPQPLSLKLPAKLEGIEADVKEKPPVTTVFVGNISDRAPDLMIRTMLQRCGNVISWKRVQGASGKLQAFGFCEFERPEATRRCVRLLNNWLIADKSLVVKVDAKTEGQLQEYFQKLPKPSEGEDAEEVQKREDLPVLAGFEAIMKEYAADLRKTPPKEHDSNILKLPKPPEPKKDQGLDDMDVEEEKKSLISREIDRFREAHKDDDDDKDKEVRKNDARRGQQQPGRSDRDRDRDKDTKRNDSMQTLQHRERPSSHERERMKDKQLAAPDRKRRSRSKEPVNAKGKDRDASPRPQNHDAEDEEEQNERRRMERKMREKEAAYQERLKAWEARERKKLRDSEKEKERTVEQKIDEEKEGRRLREFLEDYDDDRDDSKYYRGSALLRRLKEREKESEMDARDRQKEKEEIEELKKKLSDEGHPDPEGEALKLTQDVMLQARPAPVTVVSPMPKVVDVKKEEASEYVPQPVQLPSQFKSTMRPVEPSPDDSASRDTKGMGDHSAVSLEPSLHSDDSNPAHQLDHSKVTVGAIKLSASDSPADGAVGKRKKITVSEAFVADDDDTSDQPRKRKLVPIDYAEDEKSDAEKTLEEKRRAIKKLIERIPTEKEDLFSYSVDWSQVNSVLLDNRIRPWVNKKIVEYIGEEEPTLTDFICQKVMGQSTPQSILQDVAMVLDEEAEVFVVKMWRLLIYETEAKRAGLVK